MTPRPPSWSWSQWSLVLAVAWLLILILVASATYPKQAVIWATIVGTLASVVRVRSWVAERGDRRARSRRLR